MVIFTSYVKLPEGIWYDRYSLNALDALALPVATQLRN